MHRSVQRTLVLAAILVVLVLVDFMGVFIDPKEPGTLPNIPAVKESELTTLKIVRPEESVLFERRDNGWHIISPIEGPADQAAIQAIIQRLRRGISFEIEVEQNSQDLKAFGLDPGIFVEAKTADATEPISLYLGVDTAGGASFVRLPDDDTVYQAQVVCGHTCGRPLNGRTLSSLDLTPNSQSRSLLKQRWVGTPLRERLHQVHGRWQKTQHFRWIKIKSQLWSPAWLDCAQGVSIIQTIQAV